MLWIRSAHACDAPLLGELHAASWRSAYRDVLSDTFLAGDMVANRRDLWASRQGRAATNVHIFIAGRADDALGFVAMYRRHGAQDQGEGSWTSPEGREIALRRLAWNDVGPLRRASDVRQA